MFEETISTHPPQRTDEWFTQRLGKVTASRIGDVMARTKSGYGAARATYMSGLILERLTGKPALSFTSAAMQYGIDTEPQARSAYEFLTGYTVQETGFHIHPTITMAGASPDGLVNDNDGLNEGLLEIKCPQPAAHLETILTRSIPARYQLQMQWQLACTDRGWCDFVSFNPDFPASLDLFVTRVNRDDAKIAEIAAQVQAFLHELDDKLSTLKTQMEIM